MQQIKGLSPQATRELLVMNAYKVAMLKAQVEALSEIIVKNGLVSRSKLWELIQEHFED